MLPVRATLSLTKMCCTVCASAGRQIPSAKDPDLADQVRPGEAYRSSAKGGDGATAAR